MAEYASKGVANTGLGLAIAGTTLGLMNGNGGILGNVLGAGRSGIGEMAEVANAVGNLTGMTGRCSDNMPVTRYDIQNLKELMAKDQEIALLKSEQNTEIKIADVYERLATKINANEKEQMMWNQQQMINNANMSAAIATNASSIAALQETCGKITKVVVPKDAICPEFMARYNSWTAPTD